MKKNELFSNSIYVLNLFIQKEKTPPQEIDRLDCEVYRKHQAKTT